MTVEESKLFQSVKAKEEKSEVVSPPSLQELINRKQLYRGYTNQGTRDMAKLGKNQVSSFRKDPFTQTLSGVLGKTEFTLQSLLNGDYELTPSTMKIYTVMLIKMLQAPEGCKSISFTLEEYMDMTLPDDKERTPSFIDKTRAMVNRQLDLFYQMSLKYEAYPNGKPSKKKKPNVYQFRILQAKAELHNGVYNLLLTDPFIAAIQDSKQTLIHSGLLKLNTEHRPHIMAMGWYLNWYYFNIKNMKSGHNCVLSVYKILENVPSIPTTDTVKNRTYKQQIMKPFIQTLNSLKEQDILNSWAFLDKDGKEVKSDSFSFDKFLSFSVCFSMTYTPSLDSLPGRPSEDN